MAKINVLKHEMVPEHQVVKKDEEERILKDLNIGKDLLPRISKSDPAIKALEEINGPLEDGTIIKIIRNSPTAGISVYYRVVEGGLFK
ncbi:MAG: DNA-directed RNA polymerase subunit H [Candidatus Thermoplasmatota archaeon]|nr:DNA-directed RNA polymerase subunit H [Candidatus Thermoplasmatota archaeon]